MTEEARNNAPRWRSRLLLAALLAAVAVAVFWPATEFDFLNFDDDRYVLNNPHVNRGFSIENVRWAFTAVYEDWWLPMLWLSYMADTSLWGPDPFGYHLANILLHALNAALLFWILSRMTGSRWRSLFVAALFALHPLRVESVAWIAARKDVLSGLFFLLGGLAYLRHVERPQGAGRWVLLSCMALGLMSKAIVIILPFALLLLDFWPLRRASALWGRAAWTQWRPLLREKLPLFLLALAFILLNLRTHRTGGPDYTSLAPLDRLALVFPNYWDYLRQVFWPARLSIYHPDVDVVHWPTSLLALAGLAALSLLCLQQRKNRPYLLVGWLWFLLALFPVIRGIRFGLAAYADRFTYLPSIGLAIALAWLAADLVPPRRGRGALLAALALALLAACAWRTRAALPLWKNSIAAFENALVEAPEHALLHNNYGLSLIESGRAGEALPHLEKAVENSRGVTSFIANLGMALLLLDRADEAILRMESARQRLNPDCEFLNFDLGLAWMEKAEPKKAIPCFERALAAAPAASPNWRVELARAYRDDGRMQAYSNEMARAVADGFFRADVDGLRLYYLSLWENGYGRRAWTFFRRELDRDPANVLLLNNVAWYLATRPPAGADPAESLRLAQKARDLAGDAHAGILDTLAAAQAANGQFDDAVQTASLALRQAQAGGLSDLAGQIERRLDSYRRRQPWRE